VRALISGIGGFAGAHQAKHLLEAGDNVMGCTSRGTWPLDIPAAVTNNATIFPWDLSQGITTAARQQISELCARGRVSSGGYQRNERMWK
jgi:nucleoside-diphosphate-sugar epimerase